MLFMCVFIFSVLLPRVFSRVVVACCFTVRAFWGTYYDVYDLVRGAVVVVCCVRVFHDHD